MDSSKTKKINESVCCEDLQKSLSPSHNAKGFFYNNFPLFPNVAFSVKSLHKLIFNSNEKTIYLSSHSSRFILRIAF